MRAIAQITGHTLCTGHQVTVRQHHAFGLPRATAGVKDGGYVGIDQLRIIWPQWVIFIKISII